MPGIVEFPQVVKEAQTYFADLFRCVPQREHFGEYLTGLMVAARKTVSGINGEFARAGDQSCLNRFLTDADWDPTALNQRRLELLQEDAATRYDRHGVIPIDNVLIDHGGEMMANVGWFWDHAEQRNKIAHDYLFANYVCPSGKHYPLDFRLFRKRELCDACGIAFTDHNVLVRELVAWVCAEKIPGDFTFDSYFTTAETLNFVHEQKNEAGESRAYVGDLKTNRNLKWQGEIIKADPGAPGKTIPAADRKEIRHGHDRQWYFTATLTIPGVQHRVRIVILWDRKNDETPCKVLVTNRTTWEVTRILQVYRQRWTGTETFHRDGKQELGMGSCQLRDNEGQTRHMYLVMLAYSLLVRQLRDRRAKEWALTKLTTIGEACRAVLRESLRTTITQVLDYVTIHKKSLGHSLSLVGLT